MLCAAMMKRARAILANQLESTATYCDSCQVGLYDEHWNYSLVVFWRWCSILVDHNFTPADMLLDQITQKYAAGKWMHLLTDCYNLNSQCRKIP